MRVTTASRIDKTVAFSAVVVLAANQQGFPSASLWTDVDAKAGWVVPGLLLIAGIFSLSPFTARAESLLTGRRTALQRDIFIMLGRILTEARSVLPTYDHTDVGLHTWRVKRRRFMPWQTRLVRVGTYRLGGGVQLRDFTPEKGKGVVGLCWKANTEVAVDVEALASELPDRESFRLAGIRDPDHVMGLDWEAFQVVRHRGSVFAAPIRTGRGTFRGCVSLDFSSGHSLLAASSIPGTLNELSLELSGHDFDEM